MHTFLTVLLAAAPPSTTAAAHTSLTSTLITLVLIPVVVAGLTAIVTMVVTKAGEATARRRDRYADAVKTLVAWMEYPYRVRRRTDDNSATLSALATLAHDIQEQLASHHAWITADHPRLADSYAKARSTITTAVAPAVQDAWDSPPITSAAGMNLGHWGPAGACQDAITELQCDISRRFGLRRWRRSPKGCDEPNTILQSDTVPSPSPVAMADSEAA